jgi:hypothetical protein
LLMLPACAPIMAASSSSALYSPVLFGIVGMNSPRAMAAGSGCEDTAAIGSEMPRITMTTADARSMRG